MNTNDFITRTREGILRAMRYYWHVTAPIQDGKMAEVIVEAATTEHALARGHELIQSSPLVQQVVERSSVHVRIMQPQTEIVAVTSKEAHQ